jgi:hypothetical protein
LKHRQREGITSVRVVGLAVVILLVGLGSGYYLGVNRGQVGSVLNVPSSSSILAWSGSISSVDSSGGKFTINGFSAIYGFGPDLSKGASVPSFDLSLTPEQAAQLAYHQSVNVKITYVSSERVMYDSTGVISSITSSSVTILPGNETFPLVVPLSWNPAVGDAITLTI